MHGYCYGGKCLWRVCVNIGSGLLACVFSRGKLLICDVILYDVYDVVWFKPYQRGAPHDFIIVTIVISVI